LRDRAKNPQRIGLTATNLRDMEVLMINDALRKHQGNRQAAARDLGIHPATLFRKAKALGIKLPEADGRSRNQD
jgi:transcriptional regulator with PAS, ATPase and Fis domain